jgi:hypothetical protein
MKFMPTCKLRLSGILVAMFSLPLIGSSLCCRKSSNQPTPSHLSSGTASTVTVQEFSKISKRTIREPKLSIDGHINEIRLDVYAPSFDGVAIKSRRLSNSEWEKLRKTLETGTEVNNLKLLPLSARLRFFNDKNEVIYSFVLYWAEFGSVYFQNEQGWFEVYDRTPIFAVLRAKE